MSVTNLDDKRLPVFYEVKIEHRWDGTFGLSIEGIGNDPTPRSKNSVARALKEAIEIIDPSVLPIAAQSEAARLREKIAAGLHYPDCWDTAAYPTLESAIFESLDNFICAFAKKYQAGGGEVVYQGRMVGDKHWIDQSEAGYLHMLARPTIFQTQKLYTVSQTAQTEPVLDRPAKVGGTRFGQGVTWSTVIGAAQRLYEHEVTPQKEAERIKRASAVCAEIRGEKTPEPIQGPKILERVWYHKGVGDDPEDYEIFDQSQFMSNRPDCESCIQALIVEAPNWELDK